LHRDSAVVDIAPEHSSLVRAPEIQAASKAALDSTGQASHGLLCRLAATAPEGFNLRVISEKIFGLSGEMFVTQVDTTQSIVASASASASVSPLASQLPAGHLLASAAAVF
jgi:hypothetical protein